MRRNAFNLLLAVFVVIIAACENSNNDPSNGINTIQKGAGNAETVANHKASFHPDNQFTSVEDFFRWVNDTRKKYAGHARISGHPCDPNDKRTAVGSPVFPLKFIWDDDLAKRVQQEAERIAAWGEGYFYRKLDAMCL